MKKTGSSRRDFVKQSLAVAAPVMLAPNMLGLGAPESDASASRKLKVVCVGGHPDDPESGCAGTLARYVETGHGVTVVYLTRGERGIEGKSNEEAAKIRSAECEAACKIIGARPVFAGQIDGSTELSKARVDEMTRLISAENPDVVFAHWPIDTHMDHQVASILAIRACLALPRRPTLYFFEVNSGSQTQGFSPNTYVDITPMLEKKKAALFAHISQDGEGIWRKHHEIIANWRGREAGGAAAEAFVRLNRETRSRKVPEA
jgi:LmbE family N-acetylglucosaminyl deacetylase